MRRLAVPLVTLLIGVLVAVAFAQAPSAPRKTGPTKAVAAKGAPAAKPAPATTTTPAALPTEATVDAFMKHMFGYDPNVQWKVLQIKPSQAPGVAEAMVGMKNPEGQQTAVLYIMPGDKWAVAGEMIPFGADPFGPAREQLAAKAKGPARGPATSDTTIVEFSDLQCPACKNAQPTVDKLIADVPNARFIFQNYPLEGLHPWAFKAATYADCVGRESPDAFWKFIEADYANQEQVTTENVDQKMREFATHAGVNGDKVAACAAQPATAARVRESLALGNAVGVTGTPTLFVNGRRIKSVSGIPYETLKSIVQGTPAK